MVFMGRPWVVKISQMLDFFFAPTFYFLIRVLAKRRGLCMFGPHMYAKFASDGWPNTHYFSSVGRQSNANLTSVAAFCR